MNYNNNNNNNNDNNNNNNMKEIDVLNAVGKNETVWCFDDILKNVKNLNNQLRIMQNITETLKH